MYLWGWGCLCKRNRDRERAIQTAASSGSPSTGARATQDSKGDSAADISQVSLRKNRQQPLLGPIHLAGDSAREDFTKRRAVSPGTGGRPCLGPPPPPAPTLWGLRLRDRLEDGSSLSRPVPRGRPRGRARPCTLGTAPACELSRPGVASCLGHPSCLAWSWGDGEKDNPPLGGGWGGQVARGWGDTVPSNEMDKCGIVFMTGCGVLETVLGLRNSRTPHGALSQPHGPGKKTETQEQRVPQ